MTRKLQHIACIDDDEDILRIAELTLESLGGYKVTTFMSGPAALAGLKEAAPDLVLLDMMMPKMDGRQTLEAIKSRDDLKHLPVVFMTAKIQPAERSQYGSLGAAGVVAKPFDPATLASDVETIWRTLN
jgi:CheY-like chemotaxis protein